MRWRLFWYSSSIARLLPDLLFFVRFEDDIFDAIFVEIFSEILVAKEDFGFFYSAVKDTSALVELVTCCEIQQKYKHALTCIRNATDCLHHTI